MAEPFVANFMLPGVQSGVCDLLRLQRERSGLVSEAERVFGSADKAHRWLTKPRTVFDGRSPAQLAFAPGGEQLVRETLARIEHGIFS